MGVNDAKGPKAPTTARLVSRLARLLKLGSSDGALGRIETGSAASERASRED